MTGFALRAGDLDRRITFQRRAATDDGFSSQPGVFADLFTVWAQVTPVSDGERFGGGGVRSTISTRFVVRWSSMTSGISNTDSITYDGRAYGIVSIKEIGRRVGLEFSATAQG